MNALRVYDTGTASCWQTIGGGTHPCSDKLAVFAVFGRKRDTASFEAAIGFQYSRLNPGVVAFVADEGYPEFDFLVEGR